ncbi:hypothetical protein PR048_026030 [Dryococelus australis]|uniref:Uncharacterized protein n=1 Tax=Dryococelus australis TaxID=614101 RepID=A0ABQ9GK71_9NEOP|nr:hypothetical protein PR048_026030 [Dryococelus australis]
MKNSRGGIQKGAATPRQQGCAKWSGRTRGEHTEKVMERRRLIGHVAYQDGDLEAYQYGGGANTTNWLNIVHACVGARVWHAHAVCYLDTSAKLTQCQYKVAVVKSSGYSLPTMANKVQFLTGYGDMHCVSFVVYTWTRVSPGVSGCEEVCAMHVPERFRKFFMAPSLRSRCTSLSHVYASTLPRTESLVSTRRSKTHLLLMYPAFASKTANVTWSHSDGNVCSRFSNIGAWSLVTARLAFAPSINHRNSNIVMFVTVPLIHLIGVCILVTRRVGTLICARGGRMDDGVKERHQEGLSKVFPAILDLWHFSLQPGVGIFQQLLRLAAMDSRPVGSRGTRGQLAAMVSCSTLAARSRASASRRVRLLRCEPRSASCVVMFLTSSRPVSGSKILAAALPASSSRLSVLLPLELLCSSSHHACRNSRKQTMCDHERFDVLRQSGGCCRPIKAVHDKLGEFAILTLRNSTANRRRQAALRAAIMTSSGDTAKQKTRLHWLECSPPMMANRVQFPDGVAPACGTRDGRCRWSAGFLGGISPPSFQRHSVLTSLHSHQLPRLRCWPSRWASDCYPVLASKRDGKLMRQDRTYDLSNVTVAPPASLLASHQGDPGSIRIFACGNRAGRCRWSAGLLGDFPLPPPLHSGAALYSPRFIHVGSQDLNVKSRLNISARSFCKIATKAFLLTKTNQERAAAPLAIWWLIASSSDLFCQRSVKTLHARGADWDEA